ncbi:HEAT repeat-containing protein 5B-like isoform X2 [Ruditapes philippinarum]|uniref:HEAT repeat-containing protein 5B-like isoform X2 n=1 Tax=Ruditapes philippinarum TaxID=129788 RepID=UPI00295ACE9A|nr:HEAT repeat-containing protein 5B-like isoform X2 [Ruditapes philippinarum]
MMELAHSLLLNEEALQKIPDNKKPVFVFEWLRFLDKVLSAAQKSDIKEKQKRLVEQLINQISESPGPPTRKLLARCLATLFIVGDSFAMFDAINKCNEIAKSKDDSPSYLPTRLAAVACLGGIYEKMGRMTGRSYEETVQALIKSLKSAESQCRGETMMTLEKIVKGLGTAGQQSYKDVYKAAKAAMTDRAMAVRTAAAKCMYQLVNEAPFMSTTEMETVVSLCYRALDGSNYDARYAVAELLGNLCATTLNPKPNTTNARSKPVKLEDVLGLLSAGFLRGGFGFLKSSTSSSSAGVNREIRVGVTHAYVEFIKCMGGLWLERNISTFLNHVLELVANPRATPTHVDAVYARKCVSFIIRSVIGGLLGEKAQIAAAKEICQIIIKQMNFVGEASADAAESKATAADITGSQHVLVCALHELGCLVLSLGTSASPLVAEPATGIIEPVVSVLIHPSASARLSASWCLGSISVALPSQLTPLVDRCIERMNKLKSSPEAVSGYSSALTSLLGRVYQCPLGIPHAKGKQIFNIAEELLRTASQNSRLSLQRTQSGWLLLGALMTLGSPVIKGHLPRMLLLWRNAFPRSVKELESEKARGDSFTWQVTLEGRAGALGAMLSFLQHCRELITEDVIRRLLAPLECTLTMLAHMPGVIKMYGTHLKASAAMVRLRLYDVLSMLPPQSYEGTYTSLLRELVAEFTLTDNPANTTTSLLRSLCHVDDSVILGSWLQETDHKAVEDQLQPNSASGSGALEHDAHSLFYRCPISDPIPGPLPLGVAVIDSSVRLYGLIFPRVAHKHRYQMLQHFNECIKQAKSTRQQAVQMNIFTAVLCALKSLSDTKTKLGPDEVKKAAFNLILGALSSTNPILRCAAGEALGRMAQVVGDSKFIAEMAQYSFDKLKSARDVVSRTGNSLALGCLHRYVGGMGSGQHLNTSVSILLALAQDFNSPVVQVWALHALALIADSGGPMFRGYVEPTLSLVLQLLLSVPPTTVDVHQCLGKCLSALITSIGPELQGNSGSIATARLSCLVCCAIMQDHSDSLVQAEAVACLQQLHMFAPRHVNLGTLVPHLCEKLVSSHLLLRRAVVACLRQLVTREAKEVSVHALALASDEADKIEKFGITETGMEGKLFGMCDTEVDGKLISDLQDTLVSLLQTLATKDLTRWLNLLREILSSSTDATSNQQDESQGNNNDDDDDDEDNENDAEEFTAPEVDVTHPTVAPRWPTRVFATDCLRKIVVACEEDLTHFDLETAREAKKDGKCDFLVLHLSELVRMSFIAATSDSNQLRLAGLAALQDIITKFCNVPEPEFPGHVILEQYQAQVSAALRPAFSPETPSDVTAAACDVCSTWIGSGVARDLNDLRRVHQLLVSSLGKLNAGKSQCALYNESASTMEKLAVLRAWAEVYIVAVSREHGNPDTLLKSTDEDDFDNKGESLLTLVQSELPTLSQNWFLALKDHALLSLPTEFSGQLPSDGGAFYHVDTIDSARPHYRKSWPSILHALAIWLKEAGFAKLNKDMGHPGGESQPTNAPANLYSEEANAERLYLIIGICVEAMCNTTIQLPEHTAETCLHAIHALLESPWARAQVAKDPVLYKELLNVMHRVFLTHSGVKVHLAVMDVVRCVVKAAQEHLKFLKQMEESKSDKESKESKILLPPGGEGGESGEVIPGQSIVFATLEVCLGVLSRRVPALNPAAQTTGFQMSKKHSQVTEEISQLLSNVVQVLADLSSLCSVPGSLAVLPTVFHLILGLLREMSPISMDKQNSAVVTVCINCIRTLLNSKRYEGDKKLPDWHKLIQSSLATVIKNSISDADYPGMDETTYLYTITVFIICASHVINKNIVLVKPCIKAYLDCWQSEHTHIRLKCCQLFTTLISQISSEDAMPYIHIMAPKIIDYLYTCSTSPPETELERDLLLASINTFQMLIGIAEENKRITLLTVFLPILVSYLLDEKSLPTASKISRRIHDESLSHLMKIGPQYPAQFRVIMTKQTDLKARLETAIKVNQEAKSALIKAQEKAKIAAQPAKPTITLKTNFGSFA